MKLVKNAMIALLIILQTNPILLVNNNWNFKSNYYLANSRSSFQEKIQSYKPALFIGDGDIKNLYDGKEVKTAILNEIIEIKKYDSTLNAQELFFSGYDVIADDKKIEVYLSFEDEELFTITFNVYKTTRNKVAKALDEYFRSKKYQDKNDSENWAADEPYVKKYAQEKLQENEFSKKDILVEGQLVEISYKRLLFQGWNHPRPKAKNATVYLNYLAKTKKVNSAHISFSVKLEYRKDDQKEEEKEKASESIAENIAIGVGVGAIGTAVGAIAYNLITSIASAVAGSSSDAVSESSKEIIAESSKQTTKEGAKEVAKETAKKISKKTAKATTKKLIKEETKDLTKKLVDEFDKIWDKAKDVLDKQINNFSNIATETGKTVAKQTGKEIAQTISEQTGKEIAQTVGEQAVKQAVKTGVKEMISSGLKETGKDALKKAAEQITKDVAKQATKDVAKEIATETGKQVVKETAKELSKDVAKATIKQAVKTGVKESKDNLFQDLVDAMTKQIRDGWNTTPKLFFNAVRGIPKLYYLNSDNDNISEDTLNAIKEAMNEGKDEGTTEGIDEAVHQEIDEHLDGIIRDKVGNTFDKVGDDVITSLENDNQLDLNEDEITKIVNDSLPKISEDSVNQFIDQLDLNALALQEARIQMIELVKVELGGNIMKPEYELIKVNKVNLWDNLIEKTYYVDYLQKNITISVPNANQNVSLEMIEKINRYLKEQLSLITINKKTYDRWHNNNLVESSMKNFLNKNLNNQILIDEISYYFNFNDLNIKKINIENINGKDILTLEFSHSNLNDSIITININLI